MPAETPLPRAQRHPRYRRTAWRVPPSAPKGHPEPSLSRAAQLCAQPVSGQARGRVVPVLSWPTCNSHTSG